MIHEKEIHIVSESSFSVPEILIMGHKEKKYVIICDYLEKLMKIRGNPEIFKKATIYIQTQI